MSSLSPNNRIINSINRSRYIDKLKGNIGAIKENNRTPIHHKLIDKYEDLTSNIPYRYIIIFVSLLIINGILLYYFKPSFVLKKNIIEQQLKLNSNKQKINIKVISYWKLIIYSLIITIVVYSILFFMKNKSTFIGKLFELNEE